MTIVTIARKELIDLLRDGRFRASALIVFGLLVTAIVVGQQHREAYERQRAEAVAADRQAWVNQGEANPHSAAHFGRYAFKPLPATALVDRGLDDYLGVAVYIEGHRQNPFRYRPAADMTGRGDFGTLTAATLLQGLLPLLIVLLACGAFAAEREQGMLRQLLSLGTPPGALFWGKAAGLAAGLGLLIVPAALLGAYLLTAAETHDTSEALWRLGVLAAIYVVYLTVFAALSLGVSALAPTVRVALLVLLGIWVLNTLLVPRLAATAAEWRHPTPSLEEFLTQVRRDLDEGLDGHRPPRQREAELKQALMRQYGVASERDLPLNLSGYFLQQSEEHGNLVFDKRFGELRDTYRRQAAVLRAAAVASPLLAVRSASMGLAGTDLWHHERFADAAEQYRRRWVKRLNDDLTYNSRTGDTTYRVGRDFWEATEDFTYQPPPVRESLSRVWAPLALLGGWAVGAVGFALLAVGRMRGVEEA
jgi:ABC-2 type transport system permease protein